MFYIRRRFLLRVEFRTAWCFILFIPRRNLRPGPRDVTVLTTITINSPTGSFWHNYCIAARSRRHVVFLYFIFLTLFSMPPHSVATMPTITLIKCRIEEEISFFKCATRLSNGFTYKRGIRLADGDHEEGRRRKEKNAKGKLLYIHVPKTGDYEWNIINFQHRRRLNGLVNFNQNKWRWVLWFFAVPYSSVFIYSIYSTAIWVSTAPVHN